MLCLAVPLKAGPSVADSARARATWIWSGAGNAHIFGRLAENISHTTTIA